MPDRLNGADIRALCAAHGFDRTGIIPAEPSPMLDAYLRWIGNGMHGGMNYLARPDRVARRQDLSVILPGVQTLVVVALDYRQLFPADVLADPSRGRITCYAWGSDYHDVMMARLERVAAALTEQFGLSQRAYVDTGPLLERSHGQRAGLGFIGKNTMLIHPRAGSLFFLGEILLTSACDDYDVPLARASMCGSCTRCLSACPTDAFPQPYVLDARRCISYWTIEHKDDIAEDMRPMMGNWVFGCDICNDVCPFQRFAGETRTEAFQLTDVSRAAPRLTDLLGLTHEAFAARFRGTPLFRTGRDRLVRNACVAAGNWASPEAIPALTHLLGDASASVQRHARWALDRISAL
ncbi:MAG: tRNA epoxyqueuosine(34) reductase QueG [Pleurocapsa minor GSE-CHR-MK-17-07R]|jgi:epoxyqueuosine reductase|nr:tRNA epoxyqueuosine(34) reductase QueG [Pleurocapsa minor GSE-CHR-MK 17-07R]